jgi:hypothetical protein
MQSLPRPNFKSEIPADEMLETGAGSAIVRKSSGNFQMNNH